MRFLTYCVLCALFSYLLRLNGLPYYGQISLNHTTKATINKPEEKGRNAFDPKAGPRVKRNGLAQRTARLPNDNTIRISTP